VEPAVIVLFALIALLVLGGVWLIFAREWGL
jgi:hypothetical protein